MTMTEKPDSENTASRREFLVSGAALVAAAVLPAEATAGEIVSTQASPNRRSTTMINSRIRVGQENSMPIELYYEDHGTGSPVLGKAMELSSCGSRRCHRGPAAGMPLVSLAFGGWVGAGL